MALRTDLSLNQTLQQRLVLTPQVKLLIQVLQLPMLELQTLMQQELIENPVLEEVNEGDYLQDDPHDDSAQQDNYEVKELDFKREMDRLVDIDDSMRESMYRSDLLDNNEEAGERKNYLDNISARPVSLYEYLGKQLIFAGLTDGQRDIAETIIGNIDDDGYLVVQPEEMAQTLGVSVETVLEVLKVIQGFDPPGIAARDLKEALLVQLESIGKKDSLAYMIVRDNLAELEKRKFSNLAKIYGTTVSEVQAAAHVISTLEPKPGRLFGGQRTQDIVPDIILRKVEDDYVVIINDDELPHLRISSLYRRLVSDKNMDPTIREYIKNKIKSGSWLIKSIHQRQLTIYKITHEILNAQTEFLEKGFDYLNPLSLKEIAERISMHESTVSRAIANKYIQTPQGTISMRTFFSSKVKSTESGGECECQRSVKSKILSLVENEDVRNPISDEKLVELLKTQGIKVARRTVAKYRKELKVLPSNLRKSL
jgi:RNA polymerase sigma-54 factor